MCMRQDWLGPADAAEPRNRSSMGAVGWSSETTLIPNPAGVSARYLILIRIRMGVRGGREMRLNEPEMAKRRARASLAGNGTLSYPYIPTQPIYVYTYLVGS